MISLSVTSILLLTRLPALAECHLTLRQPVPYSKSTLQLDPLRNALPGSEESDFPCQLKRIGGADPFQVDQENELVVGEPQTMTFDGSASHGGGSCQLSITLDRRPTADSTFKTIASWIGGCPIDNSGGGTVPWNYTIPPEVPNGQATLAWTWVSRLSGQPEFYMNCAPITVSGGSDDTEEFDNLEDMFRVNLPSSECGSRLSSNLDIPNPGKYVTTFDRQALAPPTGSGCASKSQATATGSNTSSATTSQSMTTATTLTTLIPVPSSNATTASHASSAPTSIASESASASTGTCSTGSAPYSNSTSCSPNGALVCNGESQFGLCNWGQVVFQPVAVGTSCRDGQIVGGDAGSDSPECSPDGALVCNGSEEFGLCNFGHVVFQPVAPGTSCQNGQILRKRHAHVHRRGLSHGHHGRG